MLENIPTHLIAGSLGAGKTSLIRHLMTQRPEHEKWAVLINEFGQIGLDAALLHTTREGVVLSEIAGGCLCCVNNAPFHVALGRLLRKAKPQRLFIEPSGLGHPAALRKQLTQAPWQSVLSLQPLILVVDASSLVMGKRLPPVQADIMPKAGLLVMNKSEALDNEAKAQLTSRFSGMPLFWTAQGRVPLDCLPKGRYTRQESHAIKATISDEVSLPVVLQPSHPLRQSHEAEGYFAWGWQFHRDWHFNVYAIQEWLNNLPDLIRVKAILRTGEGWMSYNQAVEKSEWRASEWRRDSRLELIFSCPQDPSLLEEALLSHASR
ncbi:G3E family GTPase [Pseudomonas duriflava]|uniref:G3E family GTPase n=1 Tax=Pseudomonas duriflava TaxID=459528 RepID=A0A562QLV2_9PSED|nr:GTP-binding protein [Pseudomonas duriflava]TWI57699.1 G3E family GTPase [Pseudomonas duriflava]